MKNVLISLIILSVSCNNKSNTDVISSFDNTSKHQFKVTEIDNTEEITKDEMYGLKYSELAKIKLIEKEIDSLSCVIQWKTDRGFEPSVISNSGIDIYDYIFVSKYASFPSLGFSKEVDKIKIMQDKIIDYISKEKLEPDTLVNLDDLIIRNDLPYFESVLSFSREYEDKMEVELKIVSNGSPPNEVLNILFLFDKKNQIIKDYFHVGIIEF